jgi:hypothetical protein
MAKITDKEIKEFGDHLAANDWIHWPTNGCPADWDKVFKCSECGTDRGNSQEDIDQYRNYIAAMIEFLREM